MTAKTETDEPRDFIASELILDKLKDIQDKLSRIDGRIEALSAQLESFGSGIAE